MRDDGRGSLQLVATLAQLGRGIALDRAIA
jgi:hypothetical protein